MSSIYKSGQWSADLDDALANIPELGELEGKTVMITGCTGLICSAVVDVLIRWNERHGGGIRICAAGRNIEKIRNRFSPWCGEDWFDVVFYDASEPGFSPDRACDYVIHGASNASPANIIREPVETMLSNFTGMKALLDYAKAVSAKRLLFVSSSEVYGRKENNEPFRTDEYGFVDLLNARNSYSVAKRATETLCVSYAAEYGVDSVIVRPGHIYGPTASKTDNRVSSAWAYDVVRGEDIVMKSDGSQIRSYCHCLDCATAILKVLLKGESCRAYNISNPDSILTIREMAQLLTKSAGTKLRMELPTEEERKAFNPMSNSSLDSADLLRLGWKGTFDAERGFAHTVQVLREISEDGGKN